MVRAPTDDGIRRRWCPRRRRPPETPLRFRRAWRGRSDSLDRRVVLLLIATAVVIGALERWWVASHTLGTLTSDGSVVGLMALELLRHGQLHLWAVPGEHRGRQERLNVPLKRWKLSEMDIEGRNRWVEYSKAKDEMFAHCDLPDSPWYEVEADDKKRARLNCIAHLLSVVPYRGAQVGEDQASASAPRRQLPATASRPVPLRPRLRGDDPLIQ